MATKAKSFEYQGKVVEFPFENPAEENIPDEVLHEGLARPTTERTKRLKARCRFKHAAAGEFVEDNVKGGIERMRNITAAHKASEGKPEVVRRALGLAAILEGTIVLQEDELIVGYHAENPNWIPMYPELSYMAVNDYIQSKYAPQPIEEAKEINNYWTKYSLQSHCQPYFKMEELLQMYQVSTMEAPSFASGYNSIVPPYETVQEDGLLQRIALAEQHIAEARAEMAAPCWNAPERLPLIPKIDVWESMIIADKAVIAWARRHARLCRIVAENFETNAQRKEELLMIADICQRVPAEPCNVHLPFVPRH